MKDHYNVLFACTENSARSIMAEALANQLGKGRVRAFSAGSRAGRAPHPLALSVLSGAGIPVDGLRSKGWEEFTRAGSVEMDLVITVCDRAAAEPCPLWPGLPVTAHWSVPDPASVPGSEEQRQKAFSNTMQLLRHRISLLLALQPEGLDKLALQTRIGDIGKSRDATA